MDDNKWCIVISNNNNSKNYNKYCRKKKTAVIVIILILIIDTRGFDQKWLYQGKRVYTKRPTCDGPSHVNFRYRNPCAVHSVYTIIII